MTRGMVLGVVTLLCLATAGGVGLAAADDPAGGPDEGPDRTDDGEWIDEASVDDGADQRAPYVDAGLDQEVRVGDEVFLDGGGTWDDQDDIVHHEWTIETPNGGTVEPECPTCWFTSLRVEQTGQYEATLTVRDGAGNENGDSLYITVQELEPEMIVDDVGESAGNGGGGNGMCWGSHAGDTPQSWCDDHADVVDVELTDDNDAMEAIVFENGEMATEYSEWSRRADGTLAVPNQIFRDEAEGVYDIWREEEYGGGDLGGSVGSISNSGPPSVVEAMSYEPSNDTEGNAGGSPYAGGVL